MSLSIIETSGVDDIIVNIKAGFSILGSGDHYSDIYFNAYYNYRLDAISTPYTLIESVPRADGTLGRKTAYNNDGTRFAVVTEGNLNVYDTTTIPYTKISGIVAPAGEDVKYCVYSPDGSILSSE